MENCGTCKHYVHNPVSGPSCSKTGKVVSYLMQKECHEPAEAPDVLTKVCNRCHRILPLTEFHRNHTRKDGYQCQCKECQRELAQNLYSRRKAEAEDKPQEPEPPKTTKVCTKCKRELPVSSFGPNKRSSDGLKVYCKECENENCRKYRAKKYGRMSKPKPPKVDQPVINNLIEERAIPAEELTFAAAIRELLAYGSLTIKISLTKPNAQ